MIIKLRKDLVFALAVSALIASPWAMADRDDDDDDDYNHWGRLSVCEKSANKMFRSCRFEIEEELFATKAKCINQVGPDDPGKKECLKEARATYMEDREGCSAQKEARKGVCELLSENIYGPEGLLDSDNFLAEPDGSNPYFSLVPGHTYVARAGEDFEETIVVTVTDEVREILGVNCRIVVDIVLVEEEGEFVAVEVTDDYYAQALNGDVHYCGEVARNYEDGALVDLDGSFEAGRDLAKSGILIKAQPVAGDSHRQEYLLGEAEDVIKYVAGVDNPTSVGEGEDGENQNFPCNGNCIKTEEFIPPEPESGEYKYFLAGTGFVLGVALEEGEPTGERDEVQCTGDSLGVLSDCNGEDLSGLLDQLCELSPIAFCEE
jgi:hypothetical protein